MINLFANLFLLFCIVAVLYFPMKWVIKFVRKHWLQAQLDYREKHPTVGYLVLKGVEAGKASDFRWAYGGHDATSIEFKIDMVTCKLHKGTTLFVDEGIPDGERFETEIIAALHKYNAEDMRRFTPVSTLDKLKKVLEN